MTRTFSSTFSNCFSYSNLVTARKGSEGSFDVDHVVSSNYVIPLRIFPGNRKLIFGMSDARFSIVG